MSLVKWFRKNNSKVMAVVVIVLMIAFIGGTSLMQLINSGTGRNAKVAYINGDVAITEYDRYQATRELEVLRTLGADRILKVLPVNFFNTVDLHGYLLSELLFSEQNVSPDFAIYAREIIARNLYEVSEEQINDIYRRSVASDIYWYCLKHEAHSAGIRIRKDEAGQLLGVLIPQLFNNMTYSQVIESLINRTGIPEDQILSAFADLLSILRYSHLICSNENMTTRQLKQTMASDRENIDVELVEFSAGIFSEQQEEPSEEQIDEQFNKYKSFFPGFISEENSYGFGYKQPERVQLEYIAVRLRDVSEIAKKPTQDEMEEYYSNNKGNLFTEEVLSDPNDPNSPMITRTKLYSEVASLISQELNTSNINDKAESIIQEAFTLAEAPFREIESERLVELSGKELVEIAADYSEIAGRLSEKYGIKVASGRTGLLNGFDVLNDEYLSRLYFQGNGQISVYLSKVMFAVEELGISDLGPYEMAVPKLYENIGLARDTSIEIDVPAGKIVALIRVVDAVEASMPESVNAIFDTNGIIFDPNETEGDENTYAIREAVIEDLRRLSAMETAKSKAEEFLEMVAEEDDWESVVEKFNELYGEQGVDDPNQTEILSAEETFKLQDQINLRAMPQVIMNVLDRQYSNDPTWRTFAANRQRSNLLMEKFVSLVPTDSNNADIFPLIVESKPDMSYFCIKELKINRLWKEDYENSKSIQLYTQEHIQSQSLAAVHYNPENILKRMNFKVIQEEETEEITSTTESEEPS